MAAPRREYRFTCDLLHGLHARPASILAQTARRHHAAVRLSKQDGIVVDAASVLSVVGLDVRRGDACILTAEGPEADAAIAALQSLIETHLGEAKEPGGTDAISTPQTGHALPRSFRAEAISFARGRSICAGIGEGIAMAVRGFALSPEAKQARPVSLQHELAAARGALETARRDLEHRAAGANALERELLHAHAEMACDPALALVIEQAICAGKTAAQAVAAAGEEFAARLRGAGSQYIRDRALDVQDVCALVLEQLTPGGGGSAAPPSLAASTVVFAEALTANQFLQLDRRFLAGLVLGRVGPTSHTAILARSHGVPTLIDVDRPESLVKARESVVLDADGGVVITSITPTVARHYARRRQRHARWRTCVASFGRAAAVTADGVPIEIGANASTEAEVAVGMEHGMDGVGLLRTEMLFLDRASPPTEDEQFEIYAGIVAAAVGRPVIVRTFDIGADKPAPYLKMPREENPFLGVRGLRLYEHHPALLDEQLRAIVRASARGPVKVMAPMVATPSEAAWFRHHVRRVQGELAARGVPFDAAMPIGVMIEIPALAMVMDQLAKEVDFVSIGTNDLSQYAMAFDRSNGTLEHRYGVRQPSFLRLLDVIVRAARSHAKWVGVCGEMAGDPRNLPLMLGLGVNEISLAPRDIAATKAAVADADTRSCRGLLDAAIACRTREEVDALLQAMSWRRGRTILDHHLVEMASDAATKEEAIRDAVEAMVLAGRATSAGALEDAVWAREETYSTGLGYGFAIPHCKSDAVQAPTLVVTKLASPIEWGSMDAQPVAVVLLLAMPASETAGGGAVAHMKVFAKLARRLMHDEFRAALLALHDPESMVRFLKTELEIE